MSQIDMKSRAPLVSVVLPTYNRASLLGRAMESVLLQTFTDFELIVVDDGSQDATKEVVESFQDLRIRYVRHEENKGLSAGRNTGERAARGFYIANQDSDDVWDPRKLEREVVVLERAGEEVGVVYSRIEKTFGGGKKELLPPDGFYPVSGDLHEKFFEGNFITMQAALVKKECFRKVSGFDESLPALQDWDFWIRVSKHYRFQYIPDVGVYVEVSPDSITRNKKKRLMAREAIFLKHEEEFRTYPPLYARHAFRIGHAYALRGEIAKARAYLRRAWRVYPLSFSYGGAFLLSLVGSKKFYRFIARSL